MGKKSPHHPKFVRQTRARSIESSDMHRKLASKRSEHLPAWCTCPQKSDRFLLIFSPRGRSQPGVLEYEPPAKSEPCLTVSDDRNAVFSSLQETYDTRSVSSITRHHIPACCIPSIIASTPPKSLPNMTHRGNLADATILAGSG